MTTLQVGSGLQECLGVISVEDGQDFNKSASAEYKEVRGRIAAPHFSDLDVVVAYLSNIIIFVKSPIGVLSR